MGKREYFALGGLTLGFLTACHYYGPGVNLSFLLYSLLLMIAAYVAIPSVTKSAVVRNHPSLVACLLLSILAITCHHLFFSASKDTSFSPSLVLAALPVSILLGLFLGRQAFTALFWICALFAANAAVRFVWLGERASSPLVDPGTMTTLLYLAWLPWTHQNLDGARPVSRNILLLLASVTLVFTLAMFATYSRYALIVVFGALAGWLVLSLWQKIAWKSLGAVSIGIIAAFAIYTLSTNMLGGAVNESLAAMNPDVAQPSPRELLWTSTLAMIARESGWTGLGLYTFSLLYPQYRSVYEQGTQGLFAHNDFLQIFMEGGLFLFIPLLAFALFVLGRCVIEGFARGGWRASLGYWAAAACALVHASINFVLYIYPLTVLLGIVFGAGYVIAKEGRSSEKPSGSGQRKIWWQLSLVPIALVIWTLGVDVASYSVFSGQKGVPGVRQVVKTPDEAVSFAHIAAELNDDRGIPRLALAQYHAAGLVADPNESNPIETRKRTAQYFQEAIAVDPWNPMAYLSFAQFLNRNDGRKEAIEELLLKAHSLNKQDVAVANALYLFYSANDQSQKALEVARAVLQWCEFHTTRDRQGMEALVSKVQGLPGLEEETTRCNNLFAKPTLTNRKPPLVLQYFMGR